MADEHKFDKKGIPGLIHRPPLKGHFTRVPNNILRDISISFRSRGLFSYILSLPSDWKLFKTELSSHCREGRDAVNQAFDELISAGYIFSQEIRDGGRFAGFEYIINFSPHTGNPQRSEPHTENPSRLKHKKGLKSRVNEENLTSPEPENSQNLISPHPEKPEPVLPFTENPPLIKTLRNKDFNNKERNTPTGVHKKHPDPELVDFIVKWKKFIKYKTGTEPGVNGAEAKALRSIRTKIRNFISQAGTDETPLDLFHLMLTRWEDLEEWQKKNCLDPKVFDQKFIVVFNQIKVQHGQADKTWERVLAKYS